RLGRLFARLIRAPLEVRPHLQSRLGDAEGIAALGGARARPTSIDSLRDTDPFIRAAADVPIAAGLPYHSIIGVGDAAAAPELATDGLVPYASAHLDGAVSERRVVGDHHVQERPEAMLELRRILHLHLQDRGGQ
ncbi:MAG TPA: alpha/beta hydrolase, partial [Lysobacter sp.]